MAKKSQPNNPDEDFAAAVAAIEIGGEGEGEDGVVVTPGPEITPSVTSGRAVPEDINVATGQRGSNRFDKERVPGRNPGSRLGSRTMAERERGAALVAQHAKARRVRADKK